MVADNQLLYDNVTLGKGTSYPVQTIEGLDVPESRVTSVPKAGSHGGYIFADYFEPRIITLDGYVSGANIHTKETELRSILIPKPQLRALQFKFPNQVEKLVYCEPTRRDWLHGPGYKIGYMRWVAEFTASDPRLYDINEQVEPIASGVSEVMVNSGTFPTKPTVAISGPSTNPIISNETTGEDLALLITLTGSDELVLDFADHTVKLNEVSRYDLLGVESVWWDIEPGNNTISLTGGGTAEVIWRSAWM